MCARKKTASAHVLTTFLVVALLSGLAYGRVIYVDNDGPADFATIQAAIDDANDGDTVLVKPGTYTGPGNRDIDFKGKAITVKSQDGPETCIIDCQGSEADPHRAFKFIWAGDANSILDGFTIEGGYAPKQVVQGMTPVSAGGAVLCLLSSPTIRRCSLVGNVAADAGGGIYAYGGERLTVEDSELRLNSACAGGGVYCESGVASMINCRFQGNEAACGGDPSIGGSGGAIFCGGEATIEACEFTGNVAAGSGGAVSTRTSYTYGPAASVSLSGCAFRRNSAPAGGAIDALGTRVFVGKCVLSSNASRFGGAAALTRTAGATVANCTIVENVAEEEGGGLHCSGGAAELRNTVLWGNASPIGSEIRLDMSPFSATSLGVSYSDVQGWTGEVSVDAGCTLDWGVGNIDADPFFGKPNAGDYHPKSEAGRWDPVAQSWVEDEVTSPCIDAGDPMSPVGPEPFPNGGRINMGAYGGTVEASKSYFGGPTCETIMAGDINGDCRLDFRDLAILASHWMEDHASIATTYEFTADSNALSTSGGLSGGGCGSFAVEGRFQFALDRAAGTGRFQNVAATVGSEIYFYDYDGEHLTKSLDVLFRMSDLVVTSIDQTQIEFILRKNVRFFPGADVHLKVIFADGSIRLLGDFCEPVADGICYHLDAVAVAVKDHL